MTRYDAIRRRARQAGIATEICPHTFRATGITNYLRNSGSLEIAQQMAGHADVRTTTLYDRRNQQVSLDEIERITIRIRLERLGIKRQVVFSDAGLAGTTDSQHSQFTVSNDEESTVGVASTSLEQKILDLSFDRSILRGQRVRFRNFEGSAGSSLECDIPAGGTF